MIIERPNNGMLVGFEGASGVGKTFLSRKMSEETTQITTITDNPEEPLHDNIKQALNNPTDFYNRHGYPTPEALLYMSRRLIELQNQVIPKLHARQTVIHDRSFYSPCIYSSIIQAEHHESKTVQEYFDKYVQIRNTLSFKPDVNILITDEFETCRKRLQTRAEYILDDSEKDFYQRAHRWFPKLLTQMDDVEVVDISNKSVEEAIDATTSIIEDYKQMNDYA